MVMLLNPGHCNNSLRTCLDMIQTIKREKAKIKYTEVSSYLHQGDIKFKTIVCLFVSRITQILVVKSS